MKLECPSCGANVKYIIGTHQVLCTHCNEKFDIDSLTKKLYSSSKHVVVDCALMLGKDYDAVIDFHRHVVLDVVVDHILQRDRLYLNLADFEVCVVNRVVERKKIVLCVYVAPEHVHEERAFVVALLICRFFWCHRTLLLRVNWI